MNDERSRTRKVLPAVWNGAVTLWKELLRGTPPEAGVASTIDEPGAWSSIGLSPLEIQRLVAEYEFARSRIDPFEKPHQPGAPPPSSRVK